MSEQRLIDANALGDKIMKMPFYTWKDCENVLFEILSAPTIEAEPMRHGKWLHIGGDEWACSACGFVISTDGSWDHPTKKYCEECGAKMDKE